MEPKYGALSSSEDPQKLATTVTGFIKMLGGFAVFFGYTSLTGDINTFADQIGTMVTLGYAFYGAAEVAFGLGRKILIGVIARFN